MDKLVKKIAVIGQGYVGLPLAMLAVEAGYLVVGVEIEESRLRSLRSGTSYVDDITSVELRAALKTGRYLPTNEITMLEGFDIAVITVPTPLTDGVPDTSYIEVAGEQLGCYLNVGSTVILESTTYPGTTEEVLAPLLERVSGLRSGVDFYLGYSPERIDPGSKLWNIQNTPKLTAAVNRASLERVSGFYESLSISVEEVNGVKEAELAKLLENTFRHVNIAMINELAIYANGLGVNIWEVVRAAATKPFGFMSFSPGPGVGGHCLPIDPSFLSWKTRRDLGTIPRFIETANDINKRMPSYVTQRFVNGLNRAGIAVRDANVLVVGLSYKKNSTDIRESPTEGIVSLLRSLGAKVRIHDLHAIPISIEHQSMMVPLTNTLLAETDGILIATDHDDVDYELLSSSGKYILDTRNRLGSSIAELL